MKALHFCIIYRCNIGRIVIYVHIHASLQTFSASCNQIVFSSLTSLYISKKVLQNYNWAFIWQNIKILSKSVYILQETNKIKYSVKRKSEIYSQCFYFNEFTYMEGYLHLSKALETDCCVLCEEKTGKTQGKCKLKQIFAEITIKCYRTVFSFFVFNPTNTTNSYFYVSYPTMIFAHLMKLRTLIKWERKKNKWN